MNKKLEFDTIVLEFPGNDQDVSIPASYNPSTGVITVELAQPDKELDPDTDMVYSSDGSILYLAHKDINNNKIHKIEIVIFDMIKSPNES